MIQSRRAFVLSCNCTDNSALLLFLLDFVVMYFQICELKLQGYFDAIVVSGDLKWEKPQAEIFHRACQLLGVEPFECLIVGDKIETDIVGGFQARLGITVWVPNGEQGEAAPNPPPDFTIPNVTELVKVLQGGKDKNNAKNLRAKKNSTSGASSSTASTSQGAAAAAPVPSTSAAAPANKTTQPAEED